MDYLYGWLFTYNPFTQVWIAYHKDDHLEVSNNYMSEKAIRSTQHSTLVELITKSKGELEDIKQMVA